LSKKHVQYIVYNRHPVFQKYKNKKNKKEDRIDLIVTVPRDIQ